MRRRDIYKATTRTFKSMGISRNELEDYGRAGYVVIEDFISGEECDRLRWRAGELVEEFEPSEVMSIFSTHEQSRVTDEYFLESGDKIRFFFEENAFLPDGTLRQEKEKSINKIGHAMQDLDPVFDAF